MKNRPQMIKDLADMSARLNAANARVAELESRPDTVRETVRVEVPVTKVVKEVVRVEVPVIKYYKCPKQLAIISALRTKLVNG